MLQAQGKLEPAFRLQRGGRWQTMRSVDRCLELYDPEWKKSRENKKSDQPKIVMASETQQIVEQAKARQAMEADQVKTMKHKIENVQHTISRKKKKKIPQFVL